MRKILLLGLGILAPFIHAETRWCSITGRGSNDALVYPPIARAARVSGTVLSRIYFLPSGQVKDIEAISGPQMLSSSVSKQLKLWTIKTDASGDEPCQALIVANFLVIDEFSRPAIKPAKPMAPSVYEITVEVEPNPIVVNIETMDPFTRCTRFRIAFHRIVARIFG